MQRRQLDKWLHGYHKETYRTPKIFVIGCADLAKYQLAVEYKHKLEPVTVDNEPVHYDSLELVKEDLTRLGFDKAYLRLHTLTTSVAQNQQLATVTLSCL
ncbi:hypothetical protein JCM19233_1690 [Vibrio astriarenae]|nr:hypothetical protein JCM19233_1690 [Vibrio sp. C7]